jgi:hypothetical protein
VQIDPKAPLRNVRGEVMEEAGKPIEIGDIVINAFLAPQKGDEEAGVLVKSEQFRLIKRFADATGPVEVSPEELAKIRDRVARGYYLPIAGPALAVLE